MEKKLTDEEILRAFDLCGKGKCKGCSYRKDDVRCDMKKLHKDVRAIVERLQSENERLTEEKWQAQDDLANYYAMWQEEVRAKAELQKQVAKEILQEMSEKHTEIYNRYVFKSSDYDDLETNAIINFSDSLSYVVEIYFKEKYGVEVE